MSGTSTFDIALLPGDGIGPEVIDPATELLDLALSRTGSTTLSYQRLAAGAAHYQRTGDALPRETLDVVRSSDATFLGAMGLPHIRYLSGTEIAPQLDLRETLDLFAGVRPIHSIPGLPPVLSDPRGGKLDFVLVRESTEGLFSSRGRLAKTDDDVVEDTLRISRAASERLFRFAFRLARHRAGEGSRGRVTCVDKANVLGSFAYFRSIFDTVSQEFTDVDADYGYIDAVGLRMIQNPWDFDVLVTENMFGDILSDIGAGLMGGMGMAPSADIGDEHAVFQPCHGSAPDIAGKGLANPVATILSGVMMLDWLGEKHANDDCRRAAESLRAAVGVSFADGGLRPNELGGSDGTAEIVAAIRNALDG